MEKREILKLCVENGFFLDRSMLDYFVGLDSDLIFIVEKIKNLNISEKILTLDVFNKYKDKLGLSLGEKDKEKKVKILNNIRSSGSGVKTKDFIDYFRVRFEKLRDILIKKGEENLTSIRRIGNENGVFSVVGQVYDKKITKNKNLLIEIEDLTGRTVVLVNRENKQLFEQALELLLDDVLLFKCSGSSKMLFVSELVYPNGCLDKENFGDVDEFIAFSGDFHVGSRMFLEGNLMKFIDWLNGEIGDEWQKSIAKKVKYLVLVGDNVDGVGVYPGQEKSLKIKGCCSQYKKLGEFLGKIRKDVEIVMAPGLHDAVWVGEPMPSISEKWAYDLTQISNLKLVSNPCLLEIEGLKILTHHSGGVLGKLRDSIPRLRKAQVGDVVCEILKRRHLAPVYGEIDIVPDREKDDLVIEDLPDVFVFGGQHKVGVGCCNNILTISTSCWQSRTDFEEKNGFESEPCRVPILNLKSKEVKILDFSDDEVKWESGEDLVCRLDEGCKNE